MQQDPKGHVGPPNNLMLPLILCYTCTDHVGPHGSTWELTDNASQEKEDAGLDPAADAQAHHFRKVVLRVPQEGLSGFPASNPVHNPLLFITSSKITRVVTQIRLKGLSRLETFSARAANQSMSEEETAANSSQGVIRIGAKRSRDRSPPTHFQSQLIYSCKQKIVCLQHARAQILSLLCPSPSPPFRVLPSSPPLPKESEKGRRREGGRVRPRPAYG
jgi:hypothetical protein